MGLIQNDAQSGEFSGRKWVAIFFNYIRFVNIGDNGGLICRYCWTESTGSLSSHSAKRQRILKISILFHHGLR